MIISKKYAQKLIKQGKARYIHETAEQSVVHGAYYQSNKKFVGIDRLDLQRVDHYEM